MWTLHKLFCFLFTTFVIVEAGAEGEVLLLSQNNGLVGLSVGKPHKPVISADEPVVAFDIHFAWRQIFWATHSMIYRTPTYDTDTRTPLAEVGRVGSLAVDWVHHHLYWADLNCTGTRLEAAHLDGKRRRVVHRLDSDCHIGAMALDPLLGKIFWIEWNHGEHNMTRIMACNLDGSAVNTFYESELIPRDTALTIDVTKNVIYFYKVRGNSTELWDANYQVLGERLKLFEKRGDPPKSICLAKDGFYYSNKNGTYSINWVPRKYTLVYGNKVEHIASLDPYFQLLDSTLKNCNQMRVVSEVTQPQWPDQCQYHQCEHECVVITHHHDHHQQQEHRQRNTSCVCRFGYQLRADGRTCEERGFLIYSSETGFGRITPKGEDNTLLYNEPSEKIQAFDIDVAKEYVYWSVLLARTIYRAPIEQLSRKEVVVQGVNAFGLTVDWLHQLLYWTDEDQILVVPLHGGAPVVVIEGLDSPDDMAVDPIDRYIFWVECGSRLSIKRAELDGSDVTELVTHHVTCGMSLTADHVTRTLFILDWAGNVSLCHYDGSGYTKLSSPHLRALAVIDHQPLWTLRDPNGNPQYENTFRGDLNVLDGDLQPSMFKVVKASYQLEGDNVCDEAECEGICLPTKQSNTMCVCPDANKRMTECPNKIKTVKGNTPNDFLEVVAVTPFSITLKCVGPLVKHNKLRPDVLVEEVGSLVGREVDHRRRDHVRIVNLTLPFTIDGVNPATTYRLTMRHGVTRASRSITVHTPPPPLTVQRLPIITVPGIYGVVPWFSQGVHYTKPNPWEHISRTYFLLLLSKTKYSQENPPDVPRPVMDLIERQVNSSFMVLSDYTTKEEFDDDPVMNLVNIVWGETFHLAMVQATEYKGSYNLDIVYSRRFALPDPYWKSFAEKVFEDQETIDSIERT